MWNQAFKWISQYHTTEPDKKPDVKPLSKEDFEFLEKAFESVTVNETKECIKLLDKLKEKQEIKGDNDDRDFRIEIIEKILDNIDGLEVSRNLVRCKRFNEILNLFFESVHFDVKILTARLLSLMLQNDKLVQKAALDYNILKCIEYLKDNDKHCYFLKENEKLVNRTVLILSGLLIGECYEVRDAFVIQNNGFDLILNNVYNIYPMFRILKIIEDLTKPEVEKEAVPYSNKIIDQFFDKKYHHYLLNTLNKYLNSKDITEYNNEDLFESILCILNIFKNISYKFNNEDYKMFKDIINNFKSQNNFKNIKNYDNEYFDESINAIDTNYKNKAIDLGLDSKFDFETMNDGGKVLSLNKDNIEDKNNNENENEKGKEKEKTKLQIGM